MVKTLKTLVLKTVSVGVKLPTPADRIGQGLVAVVTNNPAEVLSPGRLASPHNPAPEYRGPRQELTAMRMREQPRTVASAAAPAGPAGCPTPGSSARRRPPSFRRPSSGWRTTAKWAAAAGRLAEHPAPRTPAAGDGRASFPGSSGRAARFGCDCQSPDRHDDHRTPDASDSAGRHSMAGEVARLTTAGK